MSARIYYMDDCKIGVPAGFRDRTVNVLEWDTEDGEKVGLVIQREPVPDLGVAGASGASGEAGAPAAVLSAYVAAQTQEYPAQFAGYHLERDEVAAAGVPFEIQRRAFRWKHEQHVLYHHQAFLLVGSTFIVLSGSGKARHREAIDRLLDQILADFHARGD